MTVNKIPQVAGFFIVSHAKFFGSESLGVHKNIAGAYSFLK
jgi:hypothetical protein